MARKILGTNWNKKQLDDTNENFKELYNTKDETLKIAISSKENTDKALLDVKKQGEEYKKDVENIKKETIDVAKDAKNTSDNAEMIAKDTNDNMNNIIRGQTDSAEIIQARKPVDGEAYKTVGERLNEQIGKVSDFREQDSSLISKMKNEFLERGVNVVNFGAVGDGVTDDAPSIRAAILFLEKQGGGKLFFPRPKKYYACKTANSDNAIVTINSDNISIEGFGVVDGGTCIVETPSQVESFFYFKKMNYGFNVNRFSVSGTKSFNMRSIITCDLNASPAAYVSHFSLSDVRSMYTDVGFELCSYVGTLTNCYATFVREAGFRTVIPKSGGVTTSLTFNSCYANRGQTADAVGFDINNCTYSSLNSCATDYFKIAYRTKHVKGISFNGCGCEEVEQMMLITSYQAITINGIFGLSVGKESLEKGENLYLIEFQNGKACTISGFEIAGAKKYSKKLAVTSQSFEVENITVLDGNIEYEDVFMTSNWKYKKPVYILRSRLHAIGSNRTIEIDVNSIKELQSLLSYQEINCNLTIEILDGEQTWTSGYGLYFDSISGSGNIVIKSKNKDRVILNQSIHITNCSNLIKFKDLTIKSYVVSTYNQMVVVSNSLVRMENVIFDGGGHNNGSMITAKENSRVYLSTDVVNKNDFFSSNVYSILRILDSSTIEYDKSDTIPASKYWDVGQRIYSVSDYEFLGQVYTGSSGWKKFGKVE